MGRRETIESRDGIRGSASIGDPQVVISICESTRMRVSAFPHRAATVIVIPLGGHALTRRRIKLKRHIKSVGEAGDYG
jgi:hypothetical protein